MNESPFTQTSKSLMKKDLAQLTNRLSTRKSAIIEPKKENSFDFEVWDESLKSIITFRLHDNNDVAVSLSENFRKLAASGQLDMIKLQKKVDHTSEIGRLLFSMNLLIIRVITRVICVQMDVVKI